MRKCGNCAWQVLRRAYGIALGGIRGRAGQRCGHVVVEAAVLVIPAHPQASTVTGVLMLRDTGEESNETSDTRQTWSSMPLSMVIVQ